MPDPAAQTTLRHCQDQKVGPQNFIAAASATADDMRGHATRLRMLARPEVVQVARDLVRQNKRYIALANDDLSAVPDD